MSVQIDFAIFYGFEIENYKEFIKDLTENELEDLIGYNYLIETDYYSGGRYLFGVEIDRIDAMCDMMYNVINEDMITKAQYKYYNELEKYFSLLPNDQLKNPQLIVTTICC